ncbi:FecR family protein [Chitinophaga qingshengii]|uniref:FecR domain-containing protein n=1 Tax=Chitinophaga qingshengii TaxID=1569794 RepID=A0ABR7THF2_9BACT|nr:FecR domain-containing protein [Chitinophaga qingshengii]MBC9929400.1 FecR domain-containing protein [Chitinophaga qingshengii]
MEPQERLIYLLQRHINHSLSAAETEELRNWSQSSADNGQVLEDLGDPVYREAVMRNQQQFDVESALQRVKNRAQTPVRKKIPVYWYAAAACVALLMATGYYFQRSRPVIHTPPAVAHTDDIRPGSNKAILTLADGSVISLSDAANGTLAQQTGVHISKTADGQLVYESAKESAASGPVAYNKMETPNGGQHQVILEDGSKIWLNAASSLRFPSTFRGAANRTVELQGEAYFEITKDAAHPFIVKTAQQEVKVLGTQFNINSYPEEAAIRTTLLEGAISVALPGSGPQLLKPGQQAVVTANTVAVVPVEVTEETAWKNGLFSFNGQEFRTVMSMIARWYDVKVVYDYDPGILHIGGTVSRSRRMEEVLKMLEVTGDVKFNVAGKTITVTK